MQHIQQHEVPLGCSNYVTYPIGLSLPNDRLPTNRHVLAYYFTINHVRAGFSNSENVCLDVMLHWVSCNVYTVTSKNVQTKLDGIIKSYRDLKKVPKAKRGETFYSRLKNLQVKCGALSSTSDIMMKKGKEDNKSCGASMKQTLTLNFSKIN